MQSVWLRDRSIEFSVSGVGYGFSKAIIPEAQEHPLAYSSHHWTPPFGELGLSSQGRRGYFAGLGAIILLIFSYYRYRVFNQL